MRSYIKIYGPPVYEAIQALKKLAIDMPEVCVMDPLMLATLRQVGHVSPISGASDADVEIVRNLFTDVGDVPIERCSNLISKSGEKLGDYDFFYEWFRDPKMDQLNSLLRQIDKALAGVGCRYTITTK